MNSLLLLSGGLDSCVLLAYLLSLSKKCIALSFEYGQRHRIEIDCAKKIAIFYGIEHHIIHIDPSLFSSAQSSLTNKTLEPSTLNTYVPARNLLFLAHAISFAESKNMQEIYFGANSDDILLFPDCRREFFDTMQHASLLGTRTQEPISIYTPFSSLSKRDIIALGKKVSAPMEWSFSCYNPRPDETLCGVCQACILRNNSTLQF